jgi:uncharacterized membrane protein
MRPLTGAWGGAVLAILLCLAYDTSANASVLEGGREHLTFAAILSFGGIGAVLGLIIGALAWAAEIRRETRRIVRDGETH